MTRASELPLIRTHQFPVSLMCARMVSPRGGADAVRKERRNTYYEPAPTSSAPAAAAVAAAAAARRRARCRLRRFSVFFSKAFRMMVCVASLATSCSKNGPPRVTCGNGCKGWSPVVGLTRREFSGFLQTRLAACLLDARRVPSVPRLQPLAKKFDLLPFETLPRTPAAF